MANWAVFFFDQVDKDMKEVSVLEEAFPYARVLLCTFHVLKYFKKVRHDFDFKSEEGSNMLQQVKLMLYAQNIKQYEAVRDHLLTRCGEKHKAFVNYFLKNWDSCRERWVACFRTDIPHLGNNTNNR